MAASPGFGVGDEVGLALDLHDAGGARTAMPERGPDPCAARARRDGDLALGAARHGIAGAEAQADGSDRQHQRLHGGPIGTMVA